MGVEIIASNEEVREAIYQYAKVAIKYYTDTSKVCESLYPGFKALSNDAKYRSIKFLRVNAKENFIAKNIIEKNSLCYMAIYKNGHFIESKAISSKEDVENLLNKLCY